MLNIHLLDGHPNGCLPRDGVGTSEIGGLATQVCIIPYTMQTHRPIVQHDSSCSVKLIMGRGKGEAIYGILRCPRRERL